jgi:hypothetical protein
MFGRVSLCNGSLPASTFFPSGHDSYGHVTTCIAPLVHDPEKNLFRPETFPLTVRLTNSHNLQIRCIRARFSGSPVRM